MSEKNDKELYLNFDEYIRQGEPQKKERVRESLRKKKGLRLGAWLLVCRLWMG